MTSDSPELPDGADVVLIGGGHNALVAAAYLLEAGRSVVVLERLEEAGGWVRTEEIGAPGFHHDLYSAIHSGFVGGPVWAELGGELTRHGLEYVTGRVATGSSLPDGRSATIPVDRGALDAELDRLGERDRWAGLFGDSASTLEQFVPLLGAGLDADEAQRTLAALLRDTSGDALPFGRLLATSAVDLACERFRSDELRLLTAPWPMHFGVAPESPGGALWALLLLASLAGGSPTPRGGSGRLTAALSSLVAERGGVVCTGADVDEVLVGDGRVQGVRTTDGRTVTACGAVVASVTPDQLYGRLLRNVTDVPVGVASQARAFRFGPACMQINLELSRRPHFVEPRLDAGGPINLGRGVEALVDSVRQAGAGLLPASPVLSWHEPTALDPSRAPQGCAVARIQILGLPHHPHGDAGTGIRHVDGWDDATSQAFADRVLQEAEPHLPGLTASLLARHVTSPADLAASNPNAGPGDHGGGSNALVQALTQRPIPAHGGGYRSAVPGVWLIGPSTWPSAGVTGTSGRAVAGLITT